MAGNDNAKPPVDDEKVKAKPKGPRDLSISTLPRFLLEICDEEMEKSCKRIGFDESLQLMYRRGGFSVLVKRTAKYEVPGKDGPTVLGVETPKTLFARGLLHSSVVGFLIVQKFALGVPHHRLEQHIKDQEVELDRGKLVGCWAHCRRYFFEAGICRYPAGVQGLMRIRAIYAADNAFRKLPPAQRKLMRDQHVRPLIDDFFQSVKQARASIDGRNLATRAIGYAINQEAELRRVLDDGKLPLDNTRSERSLRKIVVGRKNWMFDGSDAHAESAAAISSIIASCRLHSLDPQQYLDEILRILPYWPRDRYLELAPNNWPATGAKLDPGELNAPLCSFTIPAI